MPIHRPAVYFMDGCRRIIKNMKTIVEKITKEQLNTEEGKKIIGQDVYKRQDSRVITIR